MLTEFYPDSQSPIGRFGGVRSGQIRVITEVPGEPWSVVVVEPLVAEIFPEYIYKITDPLMRRTEVSLELSY